MIYPQRFRKTCIGLLIVLVAAIGITCTTPAHAQLQMDFTGGSGFSLSSNGTFVINNSQLYIIKTDGRKRLQLLKQSQLTVKRQGSTISAEGANDNYASTITLTQSDKNTINYSFHGVLKQATEADKPVFLGLTQGLFNANILAGKAFRGTLQNGKTVSGVIPIWLAKDGLWPIDDNYRTLEIDSRLGLLKLTVSSDSPSKVTFADARRRQLSWARPAPVFYSGVSETEPLQTNVMAATWRRRML